ncbi:MAG: YccF family protein [Henriciella sp.]|jgi:uncharacterized membrane protein YccF (DUF307 family)
MSLAGNFVWWLFGGVFLSLSWFFFGLIMFATGVGAPFGRASFTLAKLTLSPFGKDVISTAELRKAKAIHQSDESIAQGNVTLQTIGGLAKAIWFPFGLLLAIGHVFHGVILFMFIITIPLGIQSFKIAGLSLFPVGKRVVSKELAQKVRGYSADRELGKAGI